MCGTGQELGETLVHMQDVVPPEEGVLHRTSWPMGLLARTAVTMAPASVFYANVTLHV